MGNTLYCPVAVVIRMGSISIRPIYASHVTLWNYPSSITVKNVLSATHRFRGLISFSTIRHPMQPNVVNAMRKTYPRIIIQVNVLPAISSGRGKLSHLIMRWVEQWIVTPAMPGSLQQITTLDNARIVTIPRIGHQLYSTIQDLQIVFRANPGMHLYTTSRGRVQ